MKLILICCVMLSISPMASNAHTADTSCGIIWDEPILLSDSNYNAYSPKIALSGDDTVHIAWENAGQFRLPYVRSLDGGTTLLPTRELISDSIQFPGQATWMHITAQNQMVYVFFRTPVGGVSPVRMLTSTDGGASWDTVRSISPNLAGEIRSAAVSGETLAVVYATPYKEVLRSTNRGLTWSQTNDSLNYFARVALSPGVLHLVQRGSTGVGETEYRRSYDLGDSWVQTELISTVDQHTSYDMTIAANDTLLIAAWRDPKHGCLGILGCSIIARRGVAHMDSTVWHEERVLTEVPRGSQPSVAVTSARAAVTWADEIIPDETFHAAVRVTPHRDTNWCPMVDITPTTTYEVIGPQLALGINAVHVVWHQAVAPSPSTFRIFYRRGRFVTTDVREEEPAVPVSVMLQQNYPNPFNPSTTIRYTLTPSLSRGERVGDGRVKVSLRVYDMLGRVVASLVDETKGPGEYTVEWNASTSSGQALPSGAYYYRLIAGGRVETRKAVLIR